jgi:hypothetical protein
LKEEEENKFKTGRVFWRDFHPRRDTDESSSIFPSLDLSFWLDTYHLQEKRNFSFFFLFKFNRKIKSSTRPQVQWEFFKAIHLHRGLLCTG